MTDWDVVERNVAICSECNGSMALWKNRVTNQYCVSCDYCTNEYTPTKPPIDFSIVKNEVGVGLPACSTCALLDDVEQHWKSKQLDIIYCCGCQDQFERRQKPFRCPFSPLCKKELLVRPESCDTCPYADNGFCNITGQDMQICTLSLDKVCPLRKETKRR